MEIAKFRILQQKQTFFLSSNPLPWLEKCKIEGMIGIIEDIDWPYGHWWCPLHADDYHDEVEINIDQHMLSE